MACSRTVYIFRPIKIKGLICHSIWQINWQLAILLVKMLLFFYFFWIYAWKFHSFSKIVANLARKYIYWFVLYKVTNLSLTMELGFTLPNNIMYVTWFLLGSWTAGVWGWQILHIFYSWHTCTKQLLLVTLCDMTDGIESVMGLMGRQRQHREKDRYTWILK